MPPLEIISSEVFETNGVAVFKIPPGDLKLDDWMKYESNIVWKGSLRLIEQEMFNDTQQDLVLPVDRIRLKLELFNDNNKDEIWALVYYNPLMSLDNDKSMMHKSNPSPYKPTNNSHDDTNSLTKLSTSKSDATNNYRPEKVETIQTTHSYRLFKIIVQIPGSHYLGSKLLDDELVQVALGLKFDDKIDAYTFIERLQSYKKLFMSYVDQYNYEIDMQKLTESQENLSINDDDEFGEYVS